LDNLLNYPNNYVGISSMMSIAAKSFNILAISLIVLHNYFDSSTKSSNLCLAKFLDISKAKPFRMTKFYNSLRQKVSHVYHMYLQLNCKL